MSEQPEMMNLPAKGRRTAALVFIVGLAVTFFCVWRERELVRREQIIRWQDAFSQIQPILGPMLGQRFGTLQNQAKITLRHGNYSEAAWDEFTSSCEWQQRFPGMKEIGYAEFDGDKCVAKYLTATPSAPSHARGFDLNSDPALHAAVQKSTDAGYGVAAIISLGDGSNASRVALGLLPMPIRDMRPGTAAQNHTNLQGFLFFALDQQEYFHSFAKQFSKLPSELRLLAPGETAPPRTETQRVFSNSGASGEWRFVATMKAAPATTNASQWIVLAGGIALSWLLYSLFATQSRLRLEAEMANKKILQHEAEITTLNRNLEEKITARTAELHEALAEEKELNRLKSNFISMVTHEIRTPLSLILGSSEILSRYLDRLTAEKRAGHLGVIGSAVQRMSALMEDVLLFSKAEAGRIEFNPVEMDLKDFCSKMVDELLSATHARCPIELSASGVTGTARADEGMLRHIFSNLLANAVKYSPPGTPVSFFVSCEDGDAVFIVQDHGLGIPEDDRKRLFTPFYRGKNAATIHGTGLGLVIVKHCVERHGGTILIESVESLGTTATVRLPLFSPAHTEFVKRLNLVE